MIYGGMATYPDRFGTLQEVVDSILPQIDILYVYINDSDSVPECLLHERIVPILGIEHDGNLSATGKVYPLKFVNEGYFFTFDDDFIYPNDYAAKMVAAIDMFNKKALVTVHGSIFAPQADWYYERSSVYEVRRELDSYKFVNLPGSGTLAFHTSTLDVKYEDFPRKPMVDLKFAILALEQNVPILAVPRPKGWLKFLELEGLWQQNVKEITHHTTETINAGPWSFDRNRNSYQELIHALEEKDLAKLDDEVMSCLDRGTPTSWSDTKLAFSTRSKHIELIQEINNTHRLRRFIIRRWRDFKTIAAPYKAMLTTKISMLKSKSD